MHLYVVTSGSWKATEGAIANETWQFGVRYVPNSGAVLPIGTLPADSSVYPTASTINRNETNWTIQGNWILEMGVNDLDPGDWLNDQLAPAVVALIGATGLFSSGMYARQIKVYPIDESGRVAPAVPFSTGTPCTLEFKTDTYADGQVNGAMLPPQVAVVASLRTPQVGPSGRGRIFLPAPAIATTTAGGVLTPTARGNMATAVGTWLEDSALNNGTKAIPCIVPRAQSAPSAYSVIQAVRVGSVYDTQRRRRRSVPEVFSDVGVPLP